ncbi:LPXTG cell wall anchor domain-containing protein, partial [Aerococcaceae bacterium NML190938]|nr:LPXTG cell wall anchor domain-containing protein [Aerococcaceae bacterium NML190938]
AEKPVAVTVTLNNTTNQFEATTPETVVFNNECLPPTPTTATIKATVKAEGCVVGPVKVELVDEQGQVVATETANDKGEVSFNVPNLNAAKTYNYKLRQKDVVDTPHVRYDKAEKPVAVTVTLNNTTNQFEATTPETVVFNNECLPPTPTTATIKATVKAEGCVVGPVKVELVDEQGQVVATATANDKGEVSFNVPNLNMAKTYNYKLRQKDVVDTPHVRYDKAEKPVAVTVTLNNTTNQFEATTPETVVFNNECLPPTPTNATITAMIQSEGCVVGKIKVELVDKDGKVIQAKEAEPNGKVTFDPIAYDKAGENTYTVRQVAEDTPFVKYDKTPKQVKVSVTENKKENKLEAKVSEEPAFTNECIKPTPVEVIIEAKVKNEGCEVAPEATQFELLRDGKVVQTTTSKDGKVVFNKEVFDKAEKVTYQIRQLPGKTPKVIYDKTVVTVTIDVTNNDKNTLMANTSYTNDGTFVNKCEPTKEKPELPKTGEFNTVFILPVALLAIAGAVIVFKKREN